MLANIIGCFAPLVREIDTRSRFLSASECTRIFKRMSLISNFCRYRNDEYRDPIRFQFPVSILPEPTVPLSLTFVTPGIDSLRRSFISPKLVR